MLMYIGHIISLVIYIAVLVVTAICFISVSKSIIHPTLNKILYVFLLCLTTQSTLFLGLQLDWIINDYNSALGDVTSYAWLAFDYFNGLVLLSFALAVRVYLGFKKDASLSHHYKRRIEDQP